MRKIPDHRAAFTALKSLLAILLCSAGILLALSSFVVRRSEPDARAKDMPTLGERGEELDGLEQDWSNRLTYPTGIFNPEWVRRAAAQDETIERAIPAGGQLSRIGKNGFTSTLTN